ncbi:aminotransferase class I/II-fold pyridoxal phosphate-dependent enzyme [Arcanobacterium hippocoleae]|uniref:Aspartate/methionine/tyrosine aminotransferase n=1 Tax=Arcanobacterium hippocoleae TaxID=149017 RepID=A0ABU1T0S2_9ACTO|nr:aminotransferase class I/II-fold pyridoxal phosphate-dependent enzyme [Arcanobacterium hippocoleae]MDR6938958.1 aspartate/methionine/tyrosine aminotransferase [Arcanobacterium hippocoleae]
MTKIARKWAGANTFSLDVAALNKYPDVINLSIGDADFTTDQEIITAAFQDAAAGYTHYGTPQGDPELIAQIIKYWQEDFQVQLTPAQVHVTPSSALGMAQTLIALLNPGEEVIIFSPYFPIYAQQIYLAGGKSVEVALSANNGYQIDAAALEQAITANTKAIIFNNPTNPTGVVYSKDQLEIIAQIAIKHDLIVIADEIYTDFIFGQTPFIPLCTLPGMAERTITLNSFSKNFMMAGWRIGYAIAAAEYISAIGTVNDSLAYSTPAISQRAAIKALQIREKTRTKYVAEYGRRMQLVAAQIAQMPHFSLAKPNGTFYLFPGNTAGLTGRELAQEIFTQTHILVSAGESFGTSGAGHIRIACTESAEKLQAACERLARLRI